MIANVQPVQKAFQSQCDAVISLCEVFTNRASSVIVEAQTYSEFTLEATVDLLQKLVAAKSAYEMLHLQSGHVKLLYDMSVSRSGRIGVLLTDLSKEVVDSLTAGVEKMGNGVQPTSVRPFARPAE